MAERQTRRWRAARATTSLGLGLAVASLMGLAGLAANPLAGAARTQSQPASPIAQTPPSEPCKIPTEADRAPLTDGTDALDELPGVPDEEDAATPVTAGAASPASPTLAADLHLVVHALAACLSSGNYETVTDLAGGRFLGMLAGTGGTLDKETYLLIAQDLPATPFTIQAIGDTRLEADGHASADVLYASANQLFHGRWTFVETSDGSDVPTAGEAGIDWIVDSERPLVVETPDGARGVNIGLDEYKIRVDPAEIASGQPVVLKVRNHGESEHEVVVLRVGRRGDVNDLLTEPGPALPNGLAFAGQVTVSAGSRANLVLVDLQPGTYALVSLLQDSNGVPDLAHGMQATLTVK